MTISSTTARVSALTDGASNTFSVPIQAYLNTDFTVVLTTIATGLGATLTLGTDYTLTAVGSLAPPQWSLQTTLTYPTGSVLQVILNPPETQSSVFTQGQAFPSLATQTALDRGVMLTQRLQDQISRALRAPDSDNTPSMLLPSAVTRANTALLFDASGNPTVGIQTPTTLTQGVFNGFLYNNPPYVQTNAEIAAGVTPTLAYYPPGDVRRYGAQVLVSTAGLTDSTTAVAQAVAQAVAGGVSVYFPAGYCMCNITLTGNIIGLVIRGEGFNHSILVPNSSTADGLTCVAGATVWGLIIENLQFYQPNNSTAGSGIHFPTGLAQPPFNVVIRDVFCYGWGRSGIYDQAGCFTSFYDNVLVQKTGNHNFDLLGSNSMSLRNCYALGPGDPASGSTTPKSLVFTAALAAAATSATLSTNWPYASGIYTMLTAAGEWRGVTLTQGAATCTWTGGLTYAASATQQLEIAGYRVHGATPIFIACNGLNVGNIWGLFSDNPAEDGTTSYCSPKLEGCNVESFAAIGLRNKQTRMTLEKTTILGHAAGLIGVQVEPFIVGYSSTTDTDLLAGNTVTTIAVTFTGAPTGTSATLASAWTYQSGVWPVTFSDAEVRSVTLTYGATTATWTGAISGAPTASATTSSWKFGYQVHVAAVQGRPFNTVISPSGNSQLSYWDNVNLQVDAMTCDIDQQAFPPSLGVTNRFAKTLFDLNVLGAFRNSYSGTATFAAGTTVAVTFTTAAPTNAYKVKLGGNAAGYVWPTAKATTGFTLNCSASNSNATDWEVTF